MSFIQLSFELRRNNEMIGKSNDLLLVAKTCKSLHNEAGEEVAKCL